MMIEEEAYEPDASDLAYWLRLRTEDEPRPLPQRNGRINWLRRDLTDPLLRIPPEPPAVHGLIYRKKRHVLSGPQESAKTLVAYWLLLQAHRQGAPVAIVDFEMGDIAASQLLIDLGATVDELAAIYYTEPEGPPTDHDLAEILEHQTAYALIDAAAGAYDSSGLDDMSRKDAEKFARLWIRPLWRNNIGTIVLDHVTKDSKSRGKYAIGSERKTGQADVHLGFDALKPLTRGGNGLVRITVHKDRPGFLSRPTAAMADLTSHPDTHAIDLELRDPHPVDDSGEFRPTIYMEKVSHELQRWPEPRSRTQIEEAVKGKTQYVRDAIDWLVRDGYLTEDMGARGARMYTMLKPYIKPPNDPVPTPSQEPTPSPSPTPSPPRPDGVPRPRPTPSPSYGGTGVDDEVAPGTTPSPSQDQLEPLYDDDIPF